MIVGFSIWRHPSKFMNFHDVETSFLDVAKFTTLTPLSLLILCNLSFPTVCLKMSFLPVLALKSPNKIYFLVMHPAARNTTILNKVPPFATKLLSVHLFIIITPHYKFRPTGRPSSSAI
jgi:hypothetical protein